MRRLPQRARYLPLIMGRTSWWVDVIVGIAALALGAMLIIRPLTSLAMLGVYVGLSFIASGITDLVAAVRSRTPRTARVQAIAWTAAGAIVAIWQGLTFGVLGWIVAIALVVSGIVRCVAASRRAADERFAALILGTADIALGISSMQWPDVTLLVVAVLFGIRTVLFGLTTIGIALGRRRQSATETTSIPVFTRTPHGRSRLGRWSRSIAAVVALVLAVGAGAVGSQLRSDAPGIEAFYEASGDVPDRPGVLLRSEPFTQGIPPSAKAWRILYTTTREEGIPALSSGIVLVAADAPAGPRPVIAWAHGSTGFASNCAPSKLKDPLGAGALPALNAILAEKWVLVATDYTGLGTAGPHPYLIGQGEGRSVLDAVRAARQLDRIDMADETIVWGHSQGGHAALWAGQLADEYAPDVGVAGVAAIAPASDTIALTRNLPTIMGGSVFAAFVIEAYTHNYADVELSQYITPMARTLVREMASRCLAEPGALLSVLSALSIGKDPNLFEVDPTTGTFGKRLLENTPTDPIGAPLLIAQGLADPLIEPAMQQRYADGRCASGQALEYLTYPGRDHMTVVASDSPLISDLLAWTHARIAHKPGLSTCAGGR